MADNNLFLSVGEEASRGTKEDVIVGWVPLLNPAIPKMEFDEKTRDEFRGEAALSGDTAVIRMARKWAGTFEVPFFTEAGVTRSIMGTILKHFFGNSSSGQNGVTGQYYHMFYRPDNPFASSKLGSKALTFNLGINEGATAKNWPFVGGRIKTLEFIQEPGEHLKLNIEAFGQFRDTVTAAIGSPVWPDENLRCDYNNLVVYEGGTPTRTGTAPDYTELGVGSGHKTLKPDKLSLKIQNGMEDVLRLSGLDYADKTRMAGRFAATIEMTFDWEDPASGFSSVDEYNAWIAAASETNFLLIWNTGTQAGTGHHHGLIIDIPRAHRQGGIPDYALDKDPMVTLTYKALLDTATTQYLVGMLLKNTATTV